MKGPSHKCPNCGTIIIAKIDTCKVVCLFCLKEFKLVKSIGLDEFFAKKNQEMNFYSQKILEDWK